MFRHLASCSVGRASPRQGSAASQPALRPPVLRVEMVAPLDGGITGDVLGAGGPVLSGHGGGRGGGGGHGARGRGAPPGRGGAGGGGGGGGGGGRFGGGAQ